MRCGRWSSTGSSTDGAVTDHRWAAIVVNFESGGLLVDCVQSILADDSAGTVELVVVDNASSDDSVASLHAAAPRVQVVHAPGNVGYARAANLGIAATRAPIVAVLNPDLTLERGTASALVERFDGEPACGGVRAAHPQYGRHRLPLGAPSALDGGRRRPRRYSVCGGAPIRSPCATASSTPIRRVRVSSTGFRAARSGCGAPRSTKSAGGTSAISCTWRISTCVGGCGAPAGRSRTNRAARWCTCRARRRARHPYRMLVRAPPFGLALCPQAFHRRARRTAAARGRVFVAPGRHGDARTRLARVQTGTAPAASLFSSMGQASRAKRKRAAVRSAKRSRNNNWWYILTVFVLIAGIALIVYARETQPSPGRPVHPRPGQSDEPAQQGLALARRPRRVRLRPLDG